MQRNRLHRLQAALPHVNLDCVAAIAGATLNYLTGLFFHPSERPVVGFFPASGDPVIVASILEETKITSRAAMRPPAELSVRPDRARASHTGSDMASDWRDRRSRPCTAGTSWSSRPG